VQKDTFIIAYIRGGKSRMRVGPTDIEEKGFRAGGGHQTELCKRKPGINPHLDWD